MAPTTETAGPGVLPRGRLWTGAMGFAVLAAAGLAWVFVAGTRRDGGPDLVALRPGFLLLALGSAVLDVALGGVRYQVFLRRFRPGGSLWLPIRADLAGRFLGAVTPSQSGGGPAQVLVLHRGGVPVPVALSLLLVNLLATLAFFLVWGSIAALWLRDRFASDVLVLLVRYGFGTVLAVFAAMVVALVRPDLVTRPLAWAARVGGRGAEGRPSAPERAARWLARSLDPYRAACKLFVRENPWLPVASLGLTVVMYLNKFAAAWLVLRGLGVDRGLGATVALVTLVHLGVFLAPSPGGSGIAEVATGAVLSALVPGPALGPFTLVYRLLIVYLPAAAGAFVLLGELGRGRRRTASRQEATAGHAGARSRPWSHGSCRVTLALALALGGAGGPALASREADGAGSEWATVGEQTTPASCPLCDYGAPGPTPLPRERVEAAAGVLAAQNRRAIDHIGALLRAGRLGPPEGREAQRRAQLMARLALANWYSFLLPLVGDPERVWAVRPEALEPVVTRYCEATVIPLPRLRELRLGRGRVCARYDLGGPAEEGCTVLGGRRLRYRVRDVAVPGGHRRLLGLDWGSVGTGRVEALVGEHYAFRLERTQVTDEAGRRCELFLALELSGGWVRRFGVHRPAAFAFWATRPASGAPEVPPAPQVGSAIYLPGLRLRLPIVPDIDFDDVRVLALPMPFLDAEDLRRGDLPSWLPAHGDLGLDGWTSLGPVPSALRRYFPNH
ncbi:MAG TPA: lysylphosphatidylglycerol synthase transmembrane domain-containing protein [Vicinamibacteria bacterium]